MKLVIIQRLFPHYRINIFNELSKKYNLKFFHGVINEKYFFQKKKKYSLKKKLIRLKNISYLKSYLSIKKFKPDIIIQEFSLKFINLYISLIYSKICNCKFVLWGHGYNTSFHINKQPFIPKLVRFFFFKIADATILYNEKNAKIIKKKYNLKNIFFATNTIDNYQKNTIYKKLKFIGRNNVRKNLKFKNNEVNLCFISRVYLEKKTDLLLDVIYYLKKKNINVLIHLIGDGPYLNILKEKIKKLNYNNNFKFYGSLQNEKYISKIIFASDFTIIPAIAGLSIIHSFCYGTPVATLISDNHPPEFLHAINFKNSILDKTVKNLSFKISELYKNKKLYLKLRHSVRTYYEEKLTLNNMLIGFTKAIKYSFANKSK